jgi:hypothetical protein
MTPVAAATECQRNIKLTVKAQSIGLCTDFKGSGDKCLKTTARNFLEVKITDPVRFAAAEIALDLTIKKALARGTAGSACLALAAD